MTTQEEDGIPEEKRGATSGLWISEWKLHFAS